MLYKSFGWVVREYPSNIGWRKTPGDAMMLEIEQELVEKALKKIEEQAGSRLEKTAATEALKAVFSGFLSDMFSECVRSGLEGLDYYDAALFWQEYARRGEIEQGCFKKT